MQKTRPRPADDGHQIALMREKFDDARPALVGLLRYSIETVRQHSVRATFKINPAMRPILGLWVSVLEPIGWYSKAAVGLSFEHHYDRGNLAENFSKYLSFGLSDHIYGNSVEFGFARDGIGLQRFGVAANAMSIEHIRTGISISLVERDTVEHIFCRSSEPIFLAGSSRLLEAEKR